MDQPTDAAGGLAGRKGWHALEAEAVMSSLGTSHNGLSEEEAASRLSSHGHNVLSKGDEVKWWRVALEEITEPMIILLLIIGVLYSILGEPEDAVTIFAVIIALVAVEVRNELKAKKTIQALNVLSQSSATVVRGGRERDVPVEEMVPGDIVILDGGRRVPADSRIIESRGLAVDESSLTGEPVPVEKNDRQLENVALAERSSMIFPAPGDMGAHHRPVDRWLLLDGAGEGRGPKRLISSAPRRSHERAVRHSVQAAGGVVRGIVGGGHVHAERPDHPVAGDAGGVGEGA
jgi:magnesium-transporting ATPase (P-type)